VDPVQAQCVGLQLKTGLAVNNVQSEVSQGRFTGRGYNPSRLIIGPAVEVRPTPKATVEFGMLF
jgi:hypothetical protein